MSEQETPGGFGVIERNQIFVNGKWLESSGTDVITVINPATEEPVATVREVL